MVHFILHWAGLDNAGGAQYLFWSGICGDLFICGWLATWYHKHNCLVDGCKRISKHHTQYCLKHQKHERS